MSKLNVFISSTCKDLYKDRLVLKCEIENLGHNAILSESFTFPIDPSKNTIDNCIDIVRNEADVFILIIKDKYGYTVPRTGRSITHMELQTALDKGIPIYTFTYSETLRQKVLLEGQLNDGSEFMKVCKFIDEVRQERSLWNFEYNNVDGLVDTLKVQLSNLLKHSLKVRNKVDSIDKQWVFPHISSEVYRLLVYKEKNYVEKFFFQVMKDEMDRYTDLRLDYNYSMLVDLEYTHKRPSEFARWFDEIWREIYFYIKSNERLEEVFIAAYKEDNTDFRQLYYVAKRFADRYADMLRLGLHLKTVSVYPDFADMQKKILRIIDQSIEQFSSLPQRAIDRIEQNIALEIEKHSVIDGYIDFPDILTIDEKELNEISSELHMIKESFEAKRGEHTS